VGLLATIHIEPNILTLPRCASAELLFSCCDSVEELALENYNGHVAEANISRPDPPTPSVFFMVPELKRLEW
jgi:hypothetical protein